jgi:hypothetical protein
MDRCRSCGSPLPGPDGCARCGPRRGERPVLADGGDPDSGDDDRDADRRERRDRRGGDGRRDDRSAEDRPDREHSEWRSDRNSDDERDRPRRGRDRRGDRSADEPGPRRSGGEGRQPRSRRGEESTGGRGPRNRQPRERRPEREGTPRDREGGSQRPPGADQSRRSERDRRSQPRDGTESTDRRNQPPPGNERRRSRNDRRGEDRRQRDRRDGQAPQSRQGGRETAPQGGPGDGPRDSSGGDGSDGLDLGRREFLLGGAGTAALATGGWWFFLRGYDGAKGVVAEYIDALDSNDWATAGELHHSDSEFGRLSQDGQVDGYDDYLTGTLVERWEATSIEIDELYETEHVEDVEERDGFRGFDSSEDDVREFKQILAVVSEDRTGWDGLDPEADAQRKTTYRYTTAKPSGGGWAMWWARR